MSTSDRQKWDKRYGEGAYSDRTYPSALLEDWLPIMSKKPGSTALDLGCGAGRNALYLARSGFSVDGVDISQVALQKAEDSARQHGLFVNWICADLESGIGVEHVPTRLYDLIVVVRYVNLPVLAAMSDRLTANGYLLVEEHLETSQEVVGPRNPAYRLQKNQLRDSVSGLDVEFYHEGIVPDPDGKAAALAQLVARRPGAE